MRKASPRVSIGVPVFNGEHYIARALDSILSQTYEDFELIVSDNASTDATPEICRQYAARDRRIRYWRNPTNIGLQPNFHRVLDLASTEYFMWTAADDIRPPRAVEVLVETLLAHPDAVMAYGPVLLTLDGQDQVVQVTNAMPLSGRGPAGRVRVFTQRLTSNVMLYGLYRRTAAARAKLGSHLGSDYLYCLKMCLLGPIAYCPTPVLVFRCRTTTTADNPMYEDVPLTLETVLRRSGVRRKKCWTVLFRGCYYLAASPGIRWPDRARAIGAHLWTFVFRYPRKLAKEALHLLASWPLRLGRKLGRLVGRPAQPRELAR